MLQNYRYTSCESFSQIDSLPLLYTPSEASRGGDVVVRRPARGTALLFEGGTVWHGASDVTRGVRYVLSGFVGVALSS